jgi:zinc transporter ZupT
MALGTKLFWFKLGFAAFTFVEAFCAGMIPFWSKSCRESPKCMGIANAFAAGIFMAIAFLHILPEEIEIWADMWVNVYNNPADHILPLPTLLCVAGYTLILVIDKVLFDTHALIHGHDHGEGDGHGHGHGDHDHDHHEHENAAEAKFRENLKASFARVEQLRKSNPDNRKSNPDIEEENKHIKAEIKQFLNPTD